MEEATMSKEKIPRRTPEEVNELFAKVKELMESENLSAREACRRIGWPYTAYQSALFIRKNASPPSTIKQTEMPFLGNIYDQVRELQYKENLTIAQALKHLGASMHQYQKARHAHRSESAEGAAKVVPSSAPKREPTLVHVHVPPDPPKESITIMVGDPTEIKSILSMLNQGKGGK